MTCREKDRERERDSERGGGEGESESASERGPLVATPGVYYKGGIKYTGCQKMKCHPTAFLRRPPFRRATEGWGHGELRKKEKEES